MAAPTKSDILFYPGVTATPTTDSAAYGGAINTTTALVDAAADALLSNIAQDVIDKTYYEDCYCKNTATGSVNNARIANRNASKLNTASGTIQYISTSAADTGKCIKVVGKISGVYDYEYITLLNLVAVVGSKTWDANSIIRHEVLTNSTDLAATVPSGNITGSVASQTITVIYGLNDNLTDSTLACLYTTAEWRMALVTAVNTTIPAASPNNRLHPPASGISAFSRGTSWTGDDQALPVPGNILTGGSYIGIVGEYTSFTGAPLPVANLQRFHPILIGNPVA